MTKQRFLAIAAAAGVLVAPVAFADSTVDLDPYWKWSKIERTSANDNRSDAARGAQTKSSPLTDPGAYYY
jgi:hypothetical protein